MTRTDEIVIKKHFIGWGLSIMGLIIGSTITIITWVGGKYVDNVKYVRDNEGEKRLLWQSVNTNTQKLNENAASIHEQQIQITGMAEIIDRHDTWFHYLNNTPQSKWHSFASNNK